MAIVKCPQCGKSVSSKARKCPHCGLYLQSATEVRRLKRILIPVVSVCVVAILAVLFYLYSRDTNTPIPADTQNLTETITEKDIYTSEVPEELVEETDSEMEELSVVEDNSTIETIVEDALTVDSVAQLQPAVEQPQKNPAKPKVSKLDLGYAVYEPIEGATGIKNGQPHGNGIMRFKSRQTIPGTVDCLAEPGEWVNGMWRDGKINAGTWYRNDGNQVIVKLGQRYNK